MPVDLHGPPGRRAAILSDCGVAAVLAPADAGAAFWSSLPAGPPSPLDDNLALARAERHGAPPDDLAYILYTSGSTGQPKGVMHTHGSALAFVDWAQDTFTPTEIDCFASHAPFHFDLSVFDLFVALGSGACLVLIDDELGRNPRALARQLERSRVTICYSTPSVFSLLAEYGRLDRVDCSTLRAVLFAGEVFPMPALRRLQSRWPQPRYANLYGPTETNVCTAYMLPSPLPANRDRPVPIGTACSGNRCAVRDGELWVAGASVMAGYWDRPEQTAACLHTDSTGTVWYRTGDDVRETPDGFEFVGRRDRMVKRRGHRIEPGEIEATLAQHPDLLEVAVTAMAGTDATEIVAHVCPRAGRAASTIDLKRWCAERLPRAMIPDAFAVRSTLPRTTTDKIDYAAL